MLTTTLQSQSNTANVQVQTPFKQTTIIHPTSQQNFVPFLIKSHRFATQKKNPSVPPIGAYNLPSCFDAKKSILEDRASHLILQVQKKKQQMCIFKSSLTRFQKVHSPVPGPAAYNPFNSNQEQRQMKYRIVLQRQNSVDSRKTCPSIPHQQQKYGYAVVDGEMKSIKKTLEQLERERQNRRNYTATLEGEQTFLKQQQIQNYHDSDYRKKLYEYTQKIVNRQPVMTDNLSSQKVTKKPRYEHLYHSKGVQTTDRTEAIGPGHYEINGSFNLPNKQQKFQFFSSTEVRFKEKTNVEDKGYSLIEMIKESNRKSITESGKCRKSPLKKSPLLLNKEFKSRMINPGPGEYHPKDDVGKKDRGGAVFPYEQRFKQRPSQIVIDQVDQNLTLSQQQQKKLTHFGTLKRERFKRMQKTYEPVGSEQICGIFSEYSEDAEKENTVDKSHCRKKTKGKTVNVRGKKPHQMSRWSPVEDSQKVQSKACLKNLKQQLAVISYSPLPQTPYNRIAQSPNKNALIAEESS